MLPRTITKVSCCPSSVVLAGCSSEGLRDVDGQKKEIEMDQDRFELGKSARGRVLGEEYVTGALTGADAFNRDFQEMVTEYCWGEIWGRTVLSDKQRSLNNLCILAALNRPKEFKLHFKGALGNGATLDELRDTLLQIAVYAGIPAGVEAFRLGREVLEAEGIVPDPAPPS